MGSFNKVEPGNLKGKPGNSLKSLIHADKLGAASLFILSQTKFVSLTFCLSGFLVCDKLKSDAAPSLSA